MAKHWQIISAVAVEAPWKGLGVTDRHFEQFEKRGLWQASAQAGPLNNAGKLPGSVQALLVHSYGSLSEHLESQGAKTS